MQLTPINYNNAVDSGAIAANAVTAGKIATGAIDNAKQFAADVVDAAALAADSVGSSELANDAVADANVAAIAGSKIAPDFGAQKIETTGDCEVGTAAAFYLGDSGTDGSYRMRINGGDWVVEKRETGTWNQKRSFPA